MLDQVPIGPGADQGTKLIMLEMLKLDRSRSIEALESNQWSLTSHHGTKSYTTEPEFKVITKTKMSRQDFVGGMVECITFPNGDLLIINEEGKLIGLPLNPEATAVVAYDIYDNDNYVTGS